MAVGSNCVVGQSQFMLGNGVVRNGGRYGREVGATGSMNGYDQEVTMWQRHWTGTVCGRGTRTVNGVQQRLTGCGAVCLLPPRSGGDRAMAEDATAAGSKSGILC